MVIFAVSGVELGVHQGWFWVSALAVSLQEIREKLVF